MGVAKLISISQPTAHQIFRGPLQDSRRWIFSNLAIIYVKQTLALF